MGRSLPVTKRASSLGTNPLPLRSERITPTIRGYDLRIVRNFLETRRVFAAVCFLGIFVLGIRNATDPDLWWHLRTGQLILQNHHIFRSDPFSVTRLGRPWIDHEWLSQILIYGLYKLAGWAGLIVSFSVVITLAFLIVFIRCPGKPYIAGLMTVWAAISSVPSWGVRPQIFTLVLASLLLFILERSYDRIKLLWWVPLLILLWVNLHAGYAVGIAFLLLFLVGDTLDFALTQRLPASTTRLKTLGIFTLLSLAVIPLNPYGTALYRYPFETLHSPSMMAYIGEWQSPNFHEGRYVAVLLMILALLVIPAISPKKLSVREILLVIATTYAALRSVRHIPIFVLVAAPVLCSLLDARFRATTARLFNHSTPLTRTKLALNTVLLAGFVVFSVMWIRHVLGQQNEAVAKNFPVAATDFIRATMPPAPMLNHYNWGGYFIWELYPEYKVFIDGRADVYGDDFLNGFASTYYVRGTSWRSQLEDWRIRTVVLPPDAPLITVLSRSPEWKTAFSDNQATILIRTPRLP